MPELKYKLINNITIDVCKLINNKAGSRLIQEAARNFFQRMNRPIRCPLTPALYEFRDIKYDALSLPPVFATFINLKARVEIRIIGKTTPEFILFVRYDVMVVDKKAKRKP